MCNIVSKEIEGSMKMSTKISEEESKKTIWLKVKQYKGRIGQIVFVGMIAVMAIYGVVYLLGSAEKANAADTTSLYKEEEVVRGDIVVGVTELGATSLNTIDYIYEFETIIEESYVRVGEFVEVGTILARINTDSFDEGYEVLEDALAEAKVKYQELSLSYDTSKLNLQKTYDDKLNSGLTAESVYDISIAELENDLLSINVSITDMTNNIDSINTKISESYATYKIDELNANVTSIETSINNTTTEITGLITKISTVESELITLQEGGVDTTEKEVELLALKTQLLTLQENLIALGNEKVSAQSAAENALTNHNDNLSSLYSQLNSAIANLEKKELEKESYNNTLDAKKLDVQYEYDSTMSLSSTAKAEYNLALEKLNNELADAKSQVTTLELEMEAYQSLMNEGQIIATSQGYIMSIEEEGTTIRASSTVVSLAESEKVNLIVSIDQEDISSIKVGMEALVNFDAYKNNSIPAEVATISITPAAGVASSVSYQVTIECDLIPYPELVIFQGMTASITFIQMQKEDVLIVSNKCIINDQGKQYVKIINEQQEIEQIQIKTGFSDGFDVEVTEGLNEGDIVIMESVIS